MPVEAYDGRAKLCCNLRASHFRIRTSTSRGVSLEIAEIGPEDAASLSKEVDFASNGVKCRGRSAEGWFDLEPVLRLGKSGGDQSTTASVANRHNQTLHFRTLRRIGRKLREQRRAFAFGFGKAARTRIGARQVESRFAEFRVQGDGARQGRNGAIEVIQLRLEHADVGQDDRVLAIGRADRGERRERGVEVAAGRLARSQPQVRVGGRHP